MLHKKDSKTLYILPIAPEYLMCYNKYSKRKKHNITQKERYTMQYILNYYNRGKEEFNNKAELCNRLNEVEEERKGMLILTQCTDAVVEYTHYATHRERQQHTIDTLIAQQGTAWIEGYVRSILHTTHSIL